MKDLIVALRQCLRTPGFWLAAVLSLALGIGANSAIFTVLSGSVLRPLPFADPARLVMVWETAPGEDTRFVAPANFVDWRRETRSFAGLAALDIFSTTLTGRGEPERLRAMSASGNIFELLGVQAALGRVLASIDDTPGAPQVAVLTDRLWRRLFAASPSALGQSLTLGGVPHTIVGVLPPGFSLPIAASPEDLWVSGDRGVPRSFPFGGDLTSVRDSHIIWVLGRLGPGATREAAQADVSSVMTQLASRHPSTNTGLGANVVFLHDQIVGGVKPALTLLQLAVAVLLLIACANVAHLLLARAAGREAEMATRLALGAARSRLVRQLLIETLVIAVPGGLLGLALAAWGVGALVALAPAALPRLDEVRIDPAVLLFTVLVTLATAVAFGIGPALQGARTRASLAAGGGERVAGGRGVRRWQQAIVVGELALAQALLAGAALLMVSFVQAQRVELGYEIGGRVAAEINLSADRYLRPVNPASEDRRIDPAPKIQFIARVLERLAASPQVRSAAAAFTAPLEGAPNRGFRVAGDPEPRPGEEANADFQVVTADYFRTLGIPLRRGRMLSDDDRAETSPVVVINQALADRYFRGRDPIGRSIRFGFDKQHDIVGVVADARYRSVEQAADPTFYIPLPQNDERWPFLSIAVHAQGDAAGVAPLLRAAVLDADPSQPVSRIRTYEDILSASMASRRFNTLLIAVFAGTAVLLAAIGVYSVMAFAVASRTREMALRAAVGARPPDLMGLVLRQGLWLSAAATAIGLAAAALGSRLIASLLYQVAPRDPWTFAAVAALLTAVSLLAALIPARRATRVDPSAVLRV
jgi:predicted permease